LPRPPFAISAGRDTSGKTWNEWGTIAANFNAAREDFAKSLRLQNWRLDKTIPVGNLKMKSELTVWNKGQRQILLLITATGAGQCAFAWGEAREPLGAEALIH
jgi:hypothetical protein